jgi:hypothetical protein
MTYTDSEFATFDAWYIATLATNPKLANTVHFNLPHDFSEALDEWVERTKYPWTTEEA